MSKFDKFCRLVRSIVCSMWILWHVAVGYHQCLAPYYGYLPDYDSHVHDHSDSRYAAVVIVSDLCLLMQKVFVRPSR